MGMIFLSSLLTDERQDTCANFEKGSMLLLQRLGLKDCQSSNCIYTL